MWSALPQVPTGSPTEGKPPPFMAEAPDSSTAPAALPLGRPGPPTSAQPPVGFLGNPQELAPAGVAAFDGLAFGPSGGPAVAPTAAPLEVIGSTAPVGGAPRSGPQGGGGVPGAPPGSGNALGPSIDQRSGGTSSGSAAKGTSSITQASLAHQFFIIIIIIIIEAGYILAVYIRFKMLLMEVEGVKRNAQGGGFPGFRMEESVFLFFFFFFFPTFHFICSIENSVHGKLYQIQRGFHSHGDGLMIGITQ